MKRKPWRPVAAVVAPELLGRPHGTREEIVDTMIDNHQIGLERLDSQLKIQESFPGCPARDTRIDDANLIVARFAQVFFKLVRIGFLVVRNVAGVGGRAAEADNAKFAFRFHQIEFIAPESQGVVPIFAARVVGSRNVSDVVMRTVVARVERRQTLGDLSFGGIALEGFGRRDIPEIDPGRDFDDEAQDQQGCAEQRKLIDQGTLVGHEPVAFIGNGQFWKLESWRLFARRCERRPVRGALAHAADATVL